MRDDPCLPAGDALRPTAEEAKASWAARVRADREQVERLREVVDPADFYAPVAERFRVDPRRTDDPVLDVLRSLAQSDEAWLDIGAGGGRFALPLALVVRKVTAVEPSAAMRSVLSDGMSEAGITNITIVESRWPSESGAPPLEADVSLMAHVGYDIEGIGLFLDAMEAATGRLCVAIMGEAPMAGLATLLWEPVHGEPRIRLPALPELIALLIATGRLPEVRLVDRQAMTFDSYDELLTMTRRQLWVRSGSERDQRLERLVRRHGVEHDRRWSFGEPPARVGIVTWAPRS